MNSTIKTRAIGIACLLLAIVVVNSISTQFVAFRLGYHPALGVPLFAHVYNPFAFWEWLRQFFSYAPATYGYALAIFLGGTSLSVAGFKIYLGIATRSSKKHEGSHGTARFATHEDIESTGLIGGGGGVYCGGYHDEETGRTHYLRSNGPEHIAIFAPTGSGKGVGLIVPTLLSCLDSVVALDIKGELYAMTAGWRKKATNSVILRFDPAAEFGSCAWNPLQEIRFGTGYQISDTQNIALMLVDPDGKGLAGEHFRPAAKDMLAGMILYSLYKAPVVGHAPALPDIAEMLSNVGDFAIPKDEDWQDTRGKNPMEKLFIAMEKIEIANSDSSKVEQKAQSFIRGAGYRFGNTTDKEFSGILNTASNALSLYLDPFVGNNTSRSDFKISDLMDHDRPVSLYLITEARDLVRMKPLTRLFVSQLVAGLCGGMEFDSGRAKTTHKHPLLMMLDELPALGKLDIFESALAYIRGYGIKAYVVIQDVEQLIKEYGPNQSILSNCGIQLAYATNNQKTAELLSKMCGKETVIKEHIATSGKRFGLAPLGQVSTSYQEIQRDLMTPDEIRHLPRTHSTANPKKFGEMLIFMEGQHVIKGRQTPYFLDPTFDARSKIPPPKESDKVRGATSSPTKLFAVK